MHPKLLPAEMTSEQFKRTQQSNVDADWQLARGSVNGDVVTLRLLDDAEPANTDGLSVELTQTDGRWLVKNVSVSSVGFTPGDATGTGSLRLATPKSMVSEHLTISVGRSGDTVVYSFNDRWGEVAVNLQTNRGPFTQGIIEYDYRREAFDTPPVLTTISLGIYDQDRYSYYHGGQIKIHQVSDNLMSGSFDLWAENREGQRVEVTGQFDGVPVEGPNLYGG